MTLPAAMKHDADTEAGCFDALIERTAGEYTDAALDHGEDLQSYLGDDAPRPLSAWRSIFWKLGPVRGLRVLDLGCGTGVSSVILAARGARVTGVDVSPASIEVARRRASVNRVEVEYRLASAYELPFADGSFDAVAMCAVLHHMDLARVRDELLRVMAPGAPGVFMEPVVMAPWVGRLRDMIPLERNKETPDERELTPDDLAVFTEGFASCELTYMGLFASRLNRFLPDWMTDLMQIGFHRALTDADVAEYAADVGRRSLAAKLPRAAVKRFMDASSRAMIAAYRADATALRTLAVTRPFTDVVVGRVRR